MSTTPFDSVETAIQTIAAGGVVIVTDDEGRENEGDLVFAAEKTTPELVNMMIRHARGLICVPMTEPQLKRLGINPMVQQNREAMRTAFTVSVDAAEGITTGISAFDRARTIKLLAEPATRPDELVQPGHIFPLCARPGGVLERAGHTEAGVDLAALAGLRPVSVICEILNEDGTMARRPELELFAREHGLRIGTIADLIRYRLQHEESVERIAEQEIETEFGAFRMVCYEDHVTRNVHLVLIRGDLGRPEPPLVRVHVQDTLGDVVGVQSRELGWPLREAMRQIADTGHGIVVLLRYGESPRELMAAVRSLGRPENAERPAPAGGAVLRSYGIGAQILRDLGVVRMRVLSAPKQMHGLSGFGLEVVEYVDTVDGNKAG